MAGSLTADGWPAPGGALGSSSPAFDAGARVGCRGTLKGRFFGRKDRKDWALPSGKAGSGVLRVEREKKGET